MGSVVVGELPCCHSAFLQLCTPACAQPLSVVIRSGPSHAGGYTGGGTGCREDGSACQGLNMGPDPPKSL